MAMIEACAAEYDNLVQNYLWLDQQCFMLLEHYEKHMEGHKEL